MEPANPPRDSPAAARAAVAAHAVLHQQEMESQMRPRPSRRPIQGPRTGHRPATSAAASSWHHGSPARACAGVRGSRLSERAWSRPLISPLKEPHRAAAAVLHKYTIYGDTSAELPPKKASFYLFTNNCCVVARLLYASDTNSTKLRMYLSLTKKRLVPIIL